MRKIDKDITIYLNKARELISRIENNIGFETINNINLIKDRLYTTVPDIDAFENLTLSIAYLLDEKQREAENLVLGVEKYIGRDLQTGLIKNKISGRNIFASDNLLLAIIYWLQRKINEAQKQIFKVETHIGFDKQCGLLKNGINREEIYTFNSVLLAICYVVMQSSKLADSFFQKITSQVEIDRQTLLFKGIIGRKNKKGCRGIFTLDNALFAIYYTLIGDRKRAEEIISSIEKHIGFDRETGLVKRGLRDEEVYTYTSTTLAISYYSLCGKFDKFLNILK